MGAFHAGSKHNVIPGEALLQVSVRSYTDEGRERLLEGIRRIARAEALGAGAPREPEVTPVEWTPAVVNDPLFARRALAVFREAFGEENVAEPGPAMVSEDFSAFGRAGVPSLIFWLGAADPRAWAEARARGETLPSLHSPGFAPEARGAIRTGVAALTALALDVLPEP